MLLFWIDPHLYNGNLVRGNNNSMEQQQQQQQHKQKQLCWYIIACGYACGCFPFAISRTTGSRMNTSGCTVTRRLHSLWLAAMCVLFDSAWGLYQEGYDQWYASGNLNKYGYRVHVIPSVYDVPASWLLMVCWHPWLKRKMTGIL